MSPPKAYCDRCGEVTEGHQMAIKTYDDEHGDWHWVNHGELDLCEKCFHELIGELNLE